MQTISGSIDAVHGTRTNINIKNNHNRFGLRFGVLNIIKNNHNSCTNINIKNNDSNALALHGNAKFSNNINI